VNGVPVPNQSEGQQQKGDQQQTGSFRGINRVPLMLVGGIVLAFSLHHGFIVRRSETGGCRLPVRIGRSRGLYYASSVVVYRGNRLMPAFQGNSGRLVRFGVFDLDLAAGELRKNGAKLRRQEQPFQVLALLLERAGEVVTREELRQKLWPADTFVDFDHGLNTAVEQAARDLG
jgi:DNA-binding response OmpR family regulator